MKLYTPSASRIWTLSGSGLGQNITASGSSDPDGWQAASNFRSNIDLRDISDVWLAVAVTAITGSTTLQVQLDLYDDGGNLYPDQLQLTAALSAVGTASVAGGLHLGGHPLLLPEWGRVSWTVTGASPEITAEISLFGR